MDPGPSSSQVLTDFHEPSTNEHQGMQYDEAFPALANPSGPNSGPTSGLSSPSAASKWSQKMRIGSNTVTSVFNIPFEERSDRGHGDRFGEMDALKACAEITKQTEAHIEMSSSARDQSLTFLVTGKQTSVLAAKREILARFQTQAQVTVSIPKEHHRFLLGSKGATLTELEKVTATKVSIPRTNDDSNMVTVTGTREGIEKAVHEIRLISDKQSKNASEKVNIPKKYHAFICGPHNDRLRQMETDYNVRINIPPPSVMKDDIHISGEKEGVTKVVEIINKENAEYKRYGTVSVEVGKAQHKYVIGPKRNTINEILAKTGVSVEMPPTDSPSETITLRGPSDALGHALTLVYEKANSVTTRVVEAPDWIHKYIVGKKGTNIRNITANYPKAHVEIKDNQIVIEGPSEEVNPITQELEACVADLLNNKSFKEIQVDPKYHKHIIGKAGANVNRLRDETGVIISVKDVNSSTIHLEGSKAGVETAAERLLEQVSKLENEKEKDLTIEHRFHGNLIGSKGEKIREIRDRFNQVQINFPAPGEKRDVVTVRGPKEDVEQCARYMTVLYKEMLENSFQIKVPVFPQTYALVVGKANKNIRQIREDTNVRIDLPPFDEQRKGKTEAEIILITGKRENCEQARDKILELQGRLANVTEIDVMIPAKFHNTLIGAGGKMVQSISEDCGGVQIKFPDAKSKSDRVILVGPSEDCVKAREILLDLSREKEQNSFVDTVEAKIHQHKFLVGKNHSNIRKIRDATGVRVIFPMEGDANPELITIMGKKEGVAEAKKQLSEMLKDLDKVTESEMDVDPEYHRHFVIRRGEVLRQISDELGGVAISFPKAGTTSSRVLLKGPPECVEAAKKRIASIIEDLASRVTVEVIIEAKHHRTIMGAKGSKVQQIQQDHTVDIKFPERRLDDPEYEAEVNENGVRYADIIYVSGRVENCESAKEALLEQVPVRVEVEVPFEMHRFIIGTKGKDVREMMHTYDVNITVPSSEQHSNTIVIMGSPKNAAAAKVALIEKREELEAEKVQRELKSFELKVQVDPEFHPKIIGKRGAVITEIRKKHDVNIQFPSKGGEEEDDVITITGLEESAIAARDEILGIVSAITDMIKEDVELDSRVHSRIIGSRGANVRQIMKDFSVDIRFPRPNDANPNLVVISGTNIDRIYDVKDHLLNLEEEFLQDVSESEYMQQFVRDPKQDKGGKSPKDKKTNGFVVKGAPWEAPPPDTQSTEEFPSMGNGLSNASKPVGGAWGARKHY